MEHKLENYSPRFANQSPHNREVAKIIAPYLNEDEISILMEYVYEFVVLVVRNIGKMHSQVHSYLECYNSAFEQITRKEGKPFIELPCKYAYSICFDKERILFYLTDLGGNRIVRVGWDGEFIDSFGEMEIKRPVTVALSPDNTMLAVAHDVGVVLFDTETLQVLTTGIVNFNRECVGLCWLSNELLVVAEGAMLTYQRPNRIVTLLAPSLTTVSRWNIRPFPIHYPQQMVADHNKHCIYICNPSTNRIEQYDFNGNYLTAITEKTYPKLDYPMKITLDAYGTLIFSSSSGCVVLDDLDRTFSKGTPGGICIIDL
jgi:hypothetical protein